MPDEKPEKNYIAELKRRGGFTNADWDKMTQEEAKAIIEHQDRVIAEHDAEFRFEYSGMKYVVERGFEISRDAPTKETPFPYFVLSSMKVGLPVSPDPFEGIQLRYNENTFDQNGGSPPTDPQELVDVIFKYARDRLRREHPVATDPIKVFALDEAWTPTTILLEQKVNELREKYL